MESASSFNPSSLKCFRGCCALGRMRSISISRSCSDSTSSGLGVPSRALSPRPRAFLCTAMNDLLCEANVGLGSFGFDVVKQNGLAVTWRFAKPNVARNDRGQDLIAEKLLEVGHDLVGEVGAFVVHRQEDAFNFETGIGDFADLLNGFHQLGNALEGEILALNGNKDAIGSDQSVHRKDVQRRRAIDEDVV